MYGSAASNLNDGSQVYTIAYHYILYVVPTRAGLPGKVVNNFDHEPTRIARDVSQRIAFDHAEKGSLL